MRLEGLGAGRSEAQAGEIFRRGEESVVFALLQQSRLLGEWQSTPSAGPLAVSPSRPSGRRAVYTKPPPWSRQKRPGRKDGHRGVRRKRPERIDQRGEHRLSCCPHGQGKLQRCPQTRTRSTEDIPEHLQPVVSEHTLHGDGCA